MILTHITTNPELLIKLVEGKLRMWVEAQMPPLGKSSAFLGMGWVGNENGDLWCDMVSRTSQKL